MPLSREQYLGLAFPEQRNPRVPDETVAALIAGHYPKSTPEAAGELRRRGYATSVDNLDYLLSARVDAPRVKKVGKNRKWTPEHIERMAKILEELEQFTPAEWYHRYRGLDMHQRERALQEMPGAGAGFEAFREIIEPFDPKLGYCPVRFEAV